MLKYNTNNFIPSSRISDANKLNCDLLIYLYGVQVDTINKMTLLFLLQNAITDTVLYVVSKYENY